MGKFKTPSGLNLSSIWVKGAVLTPFIVLMSTCFQSKSELVLICIWDGETLSTEKKILWMTLIARLLSYKCLSQYCGCVPVHEFYP
jgi:hypothetical protein